MNSKSGDKQKTPLISVIVPCYNHASFLEQRLHSITYQTYSDIEIILLDDASTDGSQQILEAYHREEDRVHYREFNSSNSGAVNKQWIKGVAKARGDYIWIAESDDIAEPEFLETLLNVLVADREIGLAYSDSLRIDKNGNSLGLYNYQFKSYKNIWNHSFVVDGRALIRDYLVFLNVIPNVSSVLFNAKALKRALTVNEYRYCGDWACYIRLATESKVAFVHQCLNHFRQHESTTRNHNKKTYATELREKVRILRTIRDLKLDDGKNIRTSLSHWYANRHKHSRVSRFIENFRKVNPEKSIMLYGYNDICKNVLGTFKNMRQIGAIADKSKVGEHYEGVPIVDIESINLTQIDVVGICSLSHQKAMLDNIRNLGFEGHIIKA